jgi:CHAT domain-containing protein
MNIHNIIDKVNDETRNSKMAEGSILAINELLKAGYEEGVDCAYELYKLTNDRKYLENVFKLIEKSKYMLLLKSLSTAEYYDATAQVDLKNIEDSLKSEYISYQLQIESENNKDSPDSFILSDLFEKRDHYGIALDNFKTMVTEKYPDYARVKYDTLIKTYHDFTKYCEENSLLGIEFYWGLKYLYVITTNRNGPEVYKVELNDSLQTSIITLQKQLSTGFTMSSSKTDFSEFKDYSYFVFKELLLESLKGYPKDQQILIIPDGLLSQLPFEILLTEHVTGDYVDYQNLPYLIKSYLTGYAYSANLLLSKLSFSRQSDKKLLAFSYSKLEAGIDEEGRSGDQDELHHAAVELRAIRKEMGRKKSKYFYDINATEHEFKRIASEYNIIHLAVHGEADTTISMNTKLIFKNELDTLEDGELYMHELFGLDLSDAELAVLSACETGIGKSYTGEGVFSMARGFAYAGCPSIVMSLWRVDDRYTAELMKNFYKNLKNGENIVESLTNSKRRFISQSGETGAHPSNWAAFVTVGRNSIIVEKSYILYYLLGGALIFIILFIFYRLKKISF